MGVKRSMSSTWQKTSHIPGAAVPNTLGHISSPDPKGRKNISLYIKKRFFWGSSWMCQDLLSRVTSIAKTFGRMWSFNTKIVAVSLIMISHMRSAINVYRICRSVKAWDWILKHRDMSKKEVPIILRKMVTSFLPSNSSKFKWTMYKRIRMGNVKPFSERK
jgi:hypothetical protein